MKKIAIKIIFLTAVFTSSFATWYSPVVFKGHAPYKFSELVPLAKNIYKTGQFNLESGKNVFLASSLIKEKGTVSTVGNKLTAKLYANVFKFTGLLEPSEMVLFSVILNSLSLVIFAFAIMRLFGLKLATLSSLIYIFLPFNWLSVYSIGSYEFAVFFTSIFSLFFLLGREKKYEIIYLFMAGVFLTLAGLCKETFFLLAPIIPVYLWFSEKKKKAAISFFVPIVMILSIFYIPSFFSQSGGNFYSNLFFADESKEKKLADYTFYGHLYPDPYIYLYEKENFLKSYTAETEKKGFVESLERKKVLANMGEAKIGAINRFALGFVLLFRHLGAFFSLEEAGGPFVFFFSVIGFVYFKKRENWLGKFSVYWVGGTLFLLSFVALVSRSHLKDFIWLIPLLAASGIFASAKAIEEKFNFSNRKNKIIVGFISVVFLYSLILANHINLGNLYDKDRAAKDEVYADLIKEANIKDSDVIALGLDSKDVILLDYLTDKSMVVLTQDTIKKLSADGRLRQVFDDFGVKYVLGYNENISARIMVGTGAVNIATNSINFNRDRVSFGKSFLMNLVR